MQNNKSGVFVQAGILAAASMLVRIIGLLYRSPLTAIIGDEGNGYYGTAYNIYTIILMVSSYSVPSAISKLMAQKLALGQYRNAQRIFHCALMYGITVGLIGSLVLYFGAGALVPDVAVGVLRVFAPTVFFFGILGSLRGYFQAQGSMVQTSVSQILEQIANASVSMGAAWFLMHLVSNGTRTLKAQYGAMGSAVGTGAGVVTALVFIGICYARQRRYLSGRLAEDETGILDPPGKAMLETIRVITPFMLSGFILNLTTSLNQTIYYKIMIQLKHMDPVEMTTLYGIFSNKAVVISNIPISIATAVAAAIIPGISASFAKGDLEGTRQRADNASRITAIIAIPCFIGLAFLSRPVTMLLFPQMDTLGTASLLLSLLAVTVVLYSMSTITNAVLQSIGKMNMPLISAGIALTIQTVILAIGLVATDIGIYLLVFVSVIYSFMIFVVNEAFLRKYLGLRRNLKKTFGMPLLCALIMGAAALGVYALFYHILLGGMERLYFRNLISAMAAIFCAVFLYFFLLIRTGAMDRDDIRMLPKGGKIERLLVRLKWLK